jgi:cobalt-zinc-cadmium efflux system membrane fusion protein
VSFDAAAETDGKIAASDERTTQVFSPLSGQVSRIFVKLGDHVRRGQPLFAVNAAEVAQGEQDIATAMAQVKQTEAAEARQKALYKANGAALKDVQQSETDLATAQAQLASARNRLRILGLGQDQIGRIEHQGAAGATGADAVVVSPMGGVVIQKSIGLGQNLASVSLNGSATAAMTVSDLADVWLVGNLREADAPKARRGQRVEVSVGALPGRSFSGVVDFVAPTVDPTTRRVTVRADIANPTGELKPEMFASFRLLTGAASQAVGVPADAVVFEGETAHVWVAGANRTLALRQIAAGRSQNGMIEVVSGLKSGETVVTSGSLFIDRAAQGD